MPLVFAKVRETNCIKRVTGKAETRLFLEKLGFVTGAFITVVSSIGGDLIVNVKNSRVAIDKEMARGIMVSQAQ